MPRIAYSSARRIVKKRSVPGLVMMTIDGRLLSSNPVANQVLYRGDRTALFRSIRSSLRELQTRPIPDSLSTTPAGPIWRSTVKSGLRTYGLQAFWMNHQPKGKPPLVAVLLERITHSRSSRAGLRKAQRRFRLSPREIDVIEALRSGLSDKEIAVSLGIGFETVRDYLKNIRAKLGVSTRTAILSAVL